MTMKPFEIQSTSLSIGGVKLETSATGTMVIPGITRAASSIAIEVEDTADQSQSWSVAPLIIDGYFYTVLNGADAVIGFTPALYAVSELDEEGYIDGIDVVEPGAGYSDIVAASTDVMFARNPFDITILNPEVYSDAFGPDSYYGFGSELQQYNLINAQVIINGVFMDVTVVDQDNTTNGGTQTGLLFSGSFDAPLGSTWTFNRPDFDPITNFVAGEWVEIPFRVRCGAGEIESAFGGGGNANTGDITFDGRAIMGDGSIQLVPHPDVLEDGKYLQIRQGDQDSHIHLDTGNNSEYDLYLGDDSQYVRVAKTGEVVIGVNDAWEWNEQSGSRWTFEQNGGMKFPDGTTQNTAYTGQSLGSPAYKGFKAYYGSMYNNTDDNCGPINKLVIYQSPDAIPSSSISSDTDNDEFIVTDLSGSSIVAMLVTIGQNVNGTPTSELKTFVEAVIDNVILVNGEEGNFNDIGNMQASFYNNFPAFATTLSDLKTDFEFFNTSNLNYSIIDSNAIVNSGSGSGWNWYNVRYDLNSSSLVMSGGSTGGPGGFQVGDTLTIAGTNLQDYQGNTLLSPDNDLTITVDTVDGSGIPQTYTITGMVPYTSGVWPTDNINDGGNDEYDSGNYINTDLQNSISYNNGEIVSQSSAFGGGEYVVTYLNSIFGIFATNANINTIGTSGGSGFDSAGSSDTGSLYGDSGSSPSTTIEWTNPNNNVWRIEEYNGGAGVSYNGNDYDAKWFDVADSTSGSDNFRGAIIEYHAYCDNAGGTIIGTIHLGNDYTQEAATHTEHMSGNSNLASVTLWACNYERGQLYFKRTDGSSSNCMIQWTAKLFYGSENNC